MRFLFLDQGRANPRTNSCGMLIPMLQVDQADRPKRPMQREMPHETACIDPSDGVCAGSGLPVAATTVPPPPAAPARRSPGAKREFA